MVAGSELQSRWVGRWESEEALEYDSPSVLVLQYALECEWGCWLPWPLEFEWECELESP
jgi:hypothetical protein